MRAGEKNIQSNHKPFVVVIERERERDLGRDGGAPHFGLEGAHFGPELLNRLLHHSVRLQTTQRDERQRPGAVVLQKSEIE